MHKGLKQFGTAILAIGIFGGIVVGAGIHSIEIIIVSIITSLIIGIFFIGFGELLEHVYKIRVHLVGEEVVEPELPKDPITIKYPNEKD